MPSCSHVMWWTLVPALAVPVVYGGAEGAPLSSLSIPSTLLLLAVFKGDTM